jgi:pyruvate-ferredoxin/flavodoxin oxidoreductase
MQTNTPKYPGIPTTADGSLAVVWVDTHITQGACAYPITPSTNMGAGYELSVAAGGKNLWNEPIFFLESESEHSSASACEGFALCGGRVSNFTSGQGLVLMKEVLYTISGKRLPVVFHIGARALTSHSLNVHAGHDDVMAVTDCGWGMLFAKNAQEAADLGLIARRAAETSHTPFMSVQDGFLTTHTIENVLLPELEMMKEFVGDPHMKLKNYFNPAEPYAIGVVQNQDSYMKGKIAQRYFTDRVKPALLDAFTTFQEMTGRSYAPVETFMTDDADYVVIALGSVVETAQAAALWARENRGWKVGVLNVTMFRPFPGEEIVAALGHAKAISVIERMDNPLAQANPLTLEVKSAFADHSMITGNSVPLIFSGSYGLGSRDTRPGDILAVFQHMRSQEEIKNISLQGANVEAATPRWYFSLGIKHATALERTIDPDVRPKGAFSMRGHSVGGYGSVTTNKVIASLAADIFGLHVQAYPKYGSEKKGLPTTYYLTCADERILPHCELEHVEFIPLNDVNAFNVGDPLMGIADGGMVFIQTPLIEAHDVWSAIPPRAREVIRTKHVRVFYLDTVRISRESTDVVDLQQRMQGVVLLGIFLKVAPFATVHGLSHDDLLTGVERSIRKYFSKRGERVIQDNLTAVRRGFDDLMEIPTEMIMLGAQTSAMQNA